MLMASYGIDDGWGPARPRSRQDLKQHGSSSTCFNAFVVGCGVVDATVGTLRLPDLVVHRRRHHRPTGRHGQRRLYAAPPGFRHESRNLPAHLLAAGFPTPWFRPGVNGYFAGILTKVGVYSLLRVFVLSLPAERATSSPWTSCSSCRASPCSWESWGATACRWDIRRILSWHIISQVGYMVMGIGLAGSPYSACRPGRRSPNDPSCGPPHRGEVLPVPAGGIAERVSGSQHLKQMGGVIDTAPGVAGLFIVAALSLAWMPPFSASSASTCWPRRPWPAGTTWWSPWRW